MLMMLHRDRWSGMISLIWLFAMLILSICLLPRPSGADLSGSLDGSSRNSATLTGINIEANPQSAVVIFSINDPSKDPAVDYRVTTSVRLSRKWIDLELPVIRAGLFGGVGTGGGILGEILVEETSDGAGTRISIEILPANINYNIRQQDGSLVFSVTTQ